METLDNYEIKWVSDNYLKFVFKKQQLFKQGEIEDAKTTIHNETSSLISSSSTSSSFSTSLDQSSLLTSLPLQSQSEESIIRHPKEKEKKKRKEEVLLHNILTSSVLNTKDNTSFNSNIDISSNNNDSSSCSNSSDELIDIDEKSLSNSSTSSSSAISSPTKSLSNLKLSSPTKSPNKKLRSAEIKVNSNNNDNSNNNNFDDNSENISPTISKINSISDQKNSGKTNNSKNYIDSKSKPIDNIGDEEMSTDVIKLEYNIPIDGADEDSILSEPIIIKRSCLADRVGCSTIVGDRNENQDCFFLNELEEKDILLIGVLDGHGEKGEIASSLANDSINNHISNNIFVNSQFNNNINQCLADSFKMSSELLIKKGIEMDIDNGTTATVAVVTRDRTFIGWVGDSQAVLFRLCPATRTYKAQPLTTDHRPDSRSEKQRILQANGRVIHKNNSWRVVPSSRDYQESEISKKRLALNMSRALGHHILSRYGVTSEPNFVQSDLRANDILIVASDGLWNAIDYQSISAFLSKHPKDPQFISDYLSKESQRLCTKEDIQCDNVTICCYCK